MVIPDKWILHTFYQRAWSSPPLSWIRVYVHQNGGNRKTLDSTPQVANIATDEDTQSGLIVIDRNANDGPEVTHFRISGVAVPIPSASPWMQAPGQPPRANTWDAVR